MTYERIKDILRTAFGDNDTVNEAWHKINGIIDSERIDAYNVGYHDGYYAGHSESYDEGKEEGYKEGYRKGYEEGAYNAGELVMERALWLDWEDRRRISQIARGKL